MDAPNLTAEYSSFKDQINHPGYRCVEGGGVIWAYMGPSPELPGLPEFEWTLVPEDQRTFALYYQACNYLQAMEGGIDPTHVMFLHSPFDLTDQDAGLNQPSRQRDANRSGVRTPSAIEMVTTDYGFMYGAKRPLGDGTSLWRVNHFPFAFLHHASRWGPAWSPHVGPRGRRAHHQVDDRLVPFT